jgi:hypothetical protein
MPITLSSRSYPVWLGIVFICLGLASCETQDINPAISIRVDSSASNRINEKGGKAVVVFSLNGSSKKDVSFQINLGGTAKAGTDYISSETNFSIPSGSTSASFTITAIDNNLIEGDKTILLDFVSVSNAAFLDSSRYTLIISDDDKDTDNDGIPDSEDACPLDSGGVANKGCPLGFGFLLNEILYDPSNVGLAGDANNDGVYDQEGDSFVEIYNNSDVPLDLTGYTISDFVIATSLSTVRFTFPDTVLAPHKAIVVFGGGKRMASAFDSH